MEQQTTHSDSSARQRGNYFLHKAVLGICALLICAAAHAAKFTATLDRETAILGETVTLKLEFEGVNPGGVPQLPAIPGLQVIGGASTGTSTSITPEGRTSVTWISIPLTATQAGEVTIPAFQLDLAGQKLSSVPLKLKVLPEDVISPPAEFQTKPAFLWLALPKSECYVGETIIAELRLYIGPSARNIAPFNAPLPQGDGITSGRNWVSGGQLQRKVGGQNFAVLQMFCAITAIKTGPIKLNPIQATVVLNPPDPFDFFGRRGGTQQIQMTSNEKDLRALPLPQENVPPGFNNAVGNYSMNVTAGPTNVATGDPITVRVEISGRGALESLALPSQNDWKDFKAYPPTANVEVADQFGIQGKKTFEQVVTPESTDLKEIPPFTFSFFDPDAKQYRTLTQPPTPLVVRPGGSAPMPVIAGSRNQTSEPPAAAQDIVHIKPRLGTLKRITPPLLQQPWFIGVNCVPVLAWLVAIGYRKRADSLANNPRLRRQRQVAQVVRDGLAELRQHAAANESDKFFATLLRLLQEQLGERLDCPASAITEAVIDEKLRPRAVPEEDLAELHELFQTHNLARYAPVQSSRELNALIPRIENALAKIREVKL